MRKGSLRARILRRMETSPKPVFRLRDFKGYDYDQVGRAFRKLIAEGKVERVGRGLYRKLARRQPRLSFSRTWSRPSGISDDVLVATALANPSFEDLTRLCLSFGSHRIRETLSSFMDEIPPVVGAEAARMITNAERGINDAYRQVA
jgi:hypothetical protein